MRWDLDGVTGVMRLEKGWLLGPGMGLVVYCLSLSLSLYFMMCFLVSLFIFFLYMFFLFQLMSVLGYIQTVFLWQ